MNQLNGYEQMFSEIISSGQFCPPECRIDPAKPLPKEYFHPFEEEKTALVLSISGSAGSSKKPSRRLHAV